MAKSGLLKSTELGDNMNNRIEQIALRAGARKHISHLMSNPPQERVDTEMWNESIEKFARLIVEECVKELEANKRSDPYNGVEYVGAHNAALTEGIATIKEHFGVD